MQWIDRRERLPEAGREVLVWYGVHGEDAYAAVVLVGMPHRMDSDVTHWSEIEPPCNDT